jgi:hypothetical protein
LQRLVPPFDRFFMVGTLFVRGVKQDVGIRDNHGLTTPARGCMKVGFGFELISHAGEVMVVDASAQTHRARRQQFRPATGRRLERRAHGRIEDLFETFFCPVLLFVQKPLDIRVEGHGSSH